MRREKRAMRPAMPRTMRRIPRSERGERVSGGWRGAR